MSSLSLTLRDALVLPVVALCLAVPAVHAAAWLWRRTAFIDRLFTGRTPGATKTINRQHERTHT